MRPILYFILLLLLSVVVIAEEVVGEEILEETATTTVTFKVPEPGITPDNVILWKFDVWSEKFFTAITLDQTEKIHKSIASAEERLTEMEKMLRKEKAWPAEKAKLEQDDAMENARGYITYLDYQEKEKELEKEYSIQAMLLNYESVVNELRVQLDEEDLDEEATDFVLDTFAQITEQQYILATALQEKKDGTKLKIKANGLTDEQIAALEASLSNGIGELTLNFITDTVVEESDPILVFVQEETEDAVEEASEILEDVVEDLGYVIGYADGEIEEMEEDVPIAIITDTSTTTKVSVDGDVTAQQMDFITAVHDSLVAAGTDAEIEIVVAEVQKGAWKIEKEVDGVLNLEQQTLLDQMLYSLSQDPSALRIKIKYDPQSVDEEEGVYVGADEETGVSTSFVIG
jgi:hypothetical protein